MKNRKKIIGELREKVKELEEESETEFVMGYTNCRLNFYKNYIPKQKVKEVLQNNRNELFGMTCLSKEQYGPYEMQIERINKIEKELLEGERK